MDNDKNLTTRIYVTYRTEPGMLLMEYMVLRPEASVEVYFEAQGLLDLRIDENEPEA